MFVAVNGTCSYYVIMEVLFIVVLLFQSVSQPYQKMKNNIYTSLVMADLAVIIALYLYNYTRAQKTANETAEEMLIAVILLILIYLPIMCALGDIAVRCFKKIKKMKIVTSYCRFVNIQRDSQELPVQMTEEDKCQSIEVSDYIRVDDNYHCAANKFD